MAKVAPTPVCEPADDNSSEGPPADNSSSKGQRGPLFDISNKKTVSFVEPSHAPSAGSSSQAPSAGSSSGLVEMDGAFKFKRRNSAVKKASLKKDSPKKDSPKKDSPKKDSPTAPLPTEEPAKKGPPPVDLTHESLKATEWIVKKLNRETLRDAYLSVMSKLDTLLTESSGYGLNEIGLPIGLAALTALFAIGLRGLLVCLMGIAALTAFMRLKPKAQEPPSATQSAQSLAEVTLSNQKKLLKLLNDGKITPEGYIEMQKNALGAGGS